jgi:hypothetical protein
MFRSLLALFSLLLGDLGPGMDPFGNPTSDLGPEMDPNG